mgnify:CR=1 FL=1
MDQSIHNEYQIPSSNETPIVSGRDSTIMGKDDFLKILIAQLANQDPLNPMEDREFVTQMAQFSTLEQMMQMTNAIESFARVHESTALVQHSELIGKEIVWARLVEEDGRIVDIEEVTNTVISVKRDLDGSICLLLDDDRWINSEQLIQVNEKEDSTDAPEEDNDEE